MKNSQKSYVNFEEKSPEKREGEFRENTEKSLKKPKYINIKCKDVIGKYFLKSCYEKTKRRQNLEKKGGGKYLTAIQGKERCRKSL